MHRIWLNHATRLGHGRFELQSSFNRSTVLKDGARAPKHAAAAVANDQLMPSICTEMSYSSLSLLADFVQLASRCWAFCQISHPETSADDLFDPL